ncbi:MULTISPECIES: OmpA family protein [unclassified Nocardiopsis]|uniref:OmpA family protein n=1 Tax=unclassified Nocardiopsis TaxID=2649073 RepID=UPI0009F95CC5|nr:OmpA family protein [Nocardiopsis sp. TSRI0078]
MTAILLLVSGCVVTPEERLPDEEANHDTPQAPTSEPSSSPGGDQEDVIASSITSSTAIGSDYQIDIYALERVGNELLRLRFGVTNKSGKSYFFDDGLSGTKNPYTGDRITLLDPGNRTRHLSMEQNDGTCFCSVLNENIPSGDTADMWVVFPEPPSGVESMTITTPITPPLLDIPITDSSETVGNSGLADPEIIPLTMISDDTDSNTGRTESGEEVSIILSSDVLFETNSAELSPDAQEILEQVAIEINDASSSTVNVDGYADNTGSDSINIPLSQDRAEAVEAVLSELATRGGVSFKVEGHGSADPIGDNDTEEGRERNRRVSVTFEK